MNSHDVLDWEKYKAEAVKKIDEYFAALEAKQKDIEERIESAMAKMPQHSERKKA